MEWHFNGNQPLNYRTKQPDDMIFCDNERYYIGRLNFDGKWFDYQSQEFKDNIDCWAYLPDEPISLGSAEVITEWKLGNGPVLYNFKHYLLYDRDIGSIVYKNIADLYFDSKRKTFPEVSHWISLPELPLHCRNIKLVEQLKSQFINKVETQLGKPLLLEPFNEECLSQGIGELINTTIDGISQIETLSDEQLSKEILERWEYMVRLWLNNTSVGSRVRFTFGTTKVPESAGERKSIQLTLKTASIVLRTVDSSK